MDGGGLFIIIIIIILQATKDLMQEAGERLLLEALDELEVVYYDSKYQKTGFALCIIFSVDHWVISVFWNIFTCTQS